VFLLLAKGRDVPSIAKQLFISENTVRSHSKNVYRKLDVHSKQELLDLLEKNAPQ
ncbi:MAG: helix-turn-helix transcriptional regulator, partial [Gordonibacter sp.]